MMATPFQMPVRVKRRRTPPNLASAPRITSSAMPSSWATATAAVELSALCRPGIGSAIFFISCAAWPAGSRNTMLTSDKPHIGLRIFAVGDDAVILDAADQALHHRVISAHHRETVERHILDESAKRVLHGVVGLEVVEMLGIDIGDDRNVGGKFQEGAVGFVGLDHHPVAGAQARIGAIGIDDAAVDYGRI